MHFGAPIVAHSALCRLLTGRQNLALSLDASGAMLKGMNFYIHRYRLRSIQLRAVFPGRKDSLRIGRYVIPDVLLYLR
jgi:hypothetical protein